MSLRLFVYNYFDVILDSLTPLNLVPILVFDGRKHPLKADTNIQRSVKREAAFKRGGQVDDGSIRNHSLLVRVWGPRNIIYK